MQKDAPRQSIIIEAIHAWRRASHSGSAVQVNAVVMRMHPETARDVEASALAYPYNAAYRGENGDLHVWGVPVVWDETIGVGKFELDTPRSQRTTRQRAD